MEMEEALLSFPALWEEVQYGSERVLHHYNASGRGSFRKSNMHSDNTGDNAVRLLELKRKKALVKAMRQWIDTKLVEEGRGILLDKWRGYDWPKIAKCQGVKQCQAKKQWENMIQSLKDFVGRASVQDGGVYVLCQSNRQ